MKKTALSLVIPAKNEEKRISKTLSLYGSYFQAHQKEVKTEIIVVVNNSQDETVKTVLKYAEKYPFIHLLETEYASGKGGAVTLGFKRAVGNYVGFVDADGAVPPSEVYKLYEFLSDTPWLDGATAIRDPGKTSISLKRKILIKIFNLYVRLLFSLPYRDTQCGAKMFRAAVAKELAPKLSNTGWAFDVNLLLVAKYLNFRILEYPVKWSEKEGSQFSVYQGVIKTPIELLGLKNLELKFHLTKTATKILKLVHLRKKSRKPRILIFAWRDIKHPQMGGSEVYVHEVAKRLAKEHEVTLFTSNPGNLIDTDEIDRVKIIRKGGVLGVYFWAVIYYWMYFRLSADVIIDVENGIPFFTPFFVFKPKIMVLHHLHKKQWFTEFPFPIALIGYIIESVVMPLAYRNTPVITVSPSSLNELKQLGFRDSQIFLGYNSIPKKVGSVVQPSKSPLIVYVGRIRAYKRIEIALNSIKRLSKEYPKLSMTVAGAGDDEERLNTLCEKIGIKDRVDFLGFVSERKKWELLQRAWVFVMPSMKEGWGITIIEAASCGTPAVGFDVPGVRDSIRNGYTGFLASDEEDFYMKLKFLLDEKKARESMGKAGIQWAQRFSWDTTANVFRTIVTQSRSKGLLSNKYYPWDIDLRTEYLTSLSE
jgi:glycosyltransferase involved in cell wall biosynthesis